MWQLFEIFLDFLQQKTLFAYACIAIFGLCIGSFLNVVIYRLPIMMFNEWQETPSTSDKFNLNFPASHCTHCQHTLNFYDNIPLISWLILKGKSRCCHRPISLLYPLIELSSAVMSVFLFYHFTQLNQFFSALIFSYILLCLLMIDIKHQLLPDRLVYLLLALGLAVNSFAIFNTPFSAIWGVIIGFLSLWSVYFIYKLITHKEAMGYGDFKLLAALGAWCGVSQLLGIILFASILGIIIGLFYVIRAKQNVQFPFGPALAVAGWIHLLYGQNILNFWLIY